ncbi:amidase [Mycobacterium colombiense]
MTDSTPLTIAEVATRLRNGSLTSVTLTAAALTRADQLDPAVGAYVTRFDDYALDRAALADAELAAGRDRGPLHGIPVAIKDLLAMREGPTTAQSLVLDPAWGIDRDAAVVARLKLGGAVITGKTTTHEFGVGATDPGGPFPVPRNPWDLQRSPGGSSAGAGSGVASGLFFAGIGTDCGGSIRIPAAFCGVTGLMPTYGRVPTTGCVPFGYSFDRVGPLARSARDCATVLSVIAGHDPDDETSVDQPAGDYAASLGGDLSGVRVGVDRAEHFFPAESDDALASSFDAAITRLRELGAEIVDVTLPLYPQLLAANVTMASAEALAYHRDDLRSRWADYTAGSRSTFARGALVTGADYVQAARARRVGQRMLKELFGTVDVVATPTVAIGAPSLDDMASAATGELIFKTTFTMYWSAAGNPVLALPIGQTSDNMPLSMQLGGRPFDEALLCRVGHAYQSITHWHLNTPPLLVGADNFSLTHAQGDTDD